jgi:hypothetical protein
MRKKITCVAILTAMVLMGFLVVFGGQTAAGGPYANYDLNQIPYSWDSSANPGSGINIYASDDSASVISLGHSFTLYDYTTNVVTIGSNGLVKMWADTSIAWTYLNYPLGTHYYPIDYLLLPFWDDLNPSYNGGVYYHTDAAKTVITWWDVPHYYSGGIHTFQLVMRVDDTFQYNYMTIVPPCPSFDSSPTVSVVKADNMVGTQFYHYDGYFEYGTRVTSGMSILGTEAAVKPRIEIYREDFESGASGWYQGNAYPYNLWHITQHRSVSPTHSLYYGIEGQWNYDTYPYHNWGLFYSPQITITGDNPQLELQTLYESEAMWDWFFDAQWIYISVNGGYFSYLTQIWGDTSVTWNTLNMPLPAVNGDVVQFMFYFETYDNVLNQYEGWYIDDVVVTVEGEEKYTELVVVDSGFMRERIAPGGGGMAYVLVQNIGENEAKIKSYSWEGVDIAETQELGDAPPKNIPVGESVVIFRVAVHVYAGLVDGSVAGLDFKIVYNSDSGDPLEHTVDIAIQWKFHGNDRSEYVHSQDALRHMRCLDYAIEDGIVEDTTASLQMQPWLSWQETTRKQRTWL